MADFIGVMNLMPGAQRGSTISVGEATLPAPADADYTGAVTVAIRPEDLALTEAGVWHGTVEQIVDLGHYRKGFDRDSVNESRQRQNLSAEVVAACRR